MMKPLFLLTSIVFLFYVATVASPLASAVPFSYTKKRQSLGERQRRVSFPPASPLHVRGGNTDYEKKWVKRMPSLFGESESDYDKYAACLAATEGLRRLRDRELAEYRQQRRQQQRSNNGPDGKKSARQQQRDKAGPNGKKPGAISQSNDKQSLANANHNYARNSGKVLRALGMPVSRFNELSREISQDERLKEKVGCRAINDTLEELIIETKLTIYYLTFFFNAVAGYGTGVLVSHGFDY